MTALRMFILLWFVLWCVPLSGGESGSPLAPDRPQQQRLTGNPYVDFFGQSELVSGPFLESNQQDGAPPPRKSPWLAAGLSVVLPGSGELYAGSYWKAALFFAFEVAAWSVAYSFDRKGDRQTDFFQNFANEHWSVVRYARWTLDHATEINPSVNPSLYNILDQGGNVNWSELNRLERAIGGYYSHTLPLFGEQQYYELIGKYPQYNPGWDDAPPSYRYGQPLSPNFHYYSAERGKANDFYNTASTAVTIAIINHALSAIDAAWTASSHNKLQAEVSMQRVPTGEGYARVPVARLSFSF